MCRSLLQFISSMTGMTSPIGMYQIFMSCKLCRVLMYYTYVKLLGLLRNACSVKVKVLPLEYLLDVESNVSLELFSNAPFF